jgi:NDP-sugar pyrophosphorylase family protein
MKGIILAGGKGARLAPYTKILPKPLMPIGDMPILEVLLRQMKIAGIEEVVLTVGHLSHLIKAFFQDGSRLGIRIKYSYEDAPLGTAGPLSLVDGLDDTFLVSNGDVLTTMNLIDLIHFHKEEKAIATIAVSLRNVRIDFGVIECDHGHDISKYIEKPTIEYMVSMGIYVFEPGILEYIPKGKYLDLPDLVKNLLDSSERVVVYPFKGYWQDLGRPDDYENATLDFEKMQSQFFHEEIV